MDGNAIGLQPSHDVLTIWVGINHSTNPWKLKISWKPPRV